MSLVHYVAISNNSFSFLSGIMLCLAVVGANAVVSFVVSILPVLVFVVISVTCAATHMVVVERGVVTKFAVCFVVLGSRPFVYLWKRFANSIVCG